VLQKQIASLKETLAEYSEILSEHSRGSRISSGPAGFGSGTRVLAEDSFRQEMKGLV
jgi:hypothetical protein